jgi:Ser/Thr protein kinase RdoA (MazF antagonist)
LNAPAAGQQTNARELLAVARAALAAYDIAPVVYVEPMRLTNNAVFEVRTNEEGAEATRFALRVHRPDFRTVAHTRSELTFLQVLHERLLGTRVTVPQPRSTRDGRLVVEVALPVAGTRSPAATRHCDLVTWVPGRVLRPGRGLGPRATHLLGEALARVHAVAESFEPPPGFELPRWDADALFTAASPFRPGRLDEIISSDDWSLFQHVAERTRAVFDALERDGAPQEIIHADFILLNCHLSRRDRGWHVGVIDFDDLGWGHFLYDLCPLLGNLADFPRYTALSRAFLAGYRSVRPLPRALERHLPLLMAARHAASCAWVAGIERTSGTGPPVAEHIAMRMDRIRHCLALAS